MNRNFIESTAGTAVKEAFVKATGPVPYTMTNDYLFRAVFQSNEKALKGLICSLLHLKEEEVEALVISNPIDLGERIYEKEIVMDIKLTLNNKSIINIEMQVDNEHNWTDRSLVYTCRSFGSLNRGDEYVMVKPVIHISFLDFELFPKFPEFYATYQLLNVKNCNKYSDKLTISVVNLNRTDLATEKDKADGVDYWARLFKSTTWEEIKTLAEKNMSIREAASAMYDFTSDEVIREHLEMREEFLRRQRTRERLMEIAEEKLKVAEERLEEAEEKTKEAEEKAKEAEEKAKEAEEKAKEAEEKARVAEEKARKAEEQAKDSYEKDLEIVRLRSELEALKK